MRKQLEQLLTTANISIDPKACINFANRKGQCSSCLDACPTSALELINNIPKIKESSCINCGACVSACPTIAIDHIQKPYVDTSEKVKEYTNSNITCDQLEKYQKGIKIPCYLYLDLPLLLQYTKGKENIKIFTGKCKSCHKAETIDVEAHIKKLVNQLAQYDKSTRVEWMTTTEFIQEDDQTINGVTRRELLGMFSIKSIRKIILPEEDDRKQEKGEGAFRSNEEKALYKREIINQYLSEKLEEDESAAQEIKASNELYSYLNMKQIDSCNGCNICEEICPTDAISWTNDGESSKLTFTATKCIGCLKCTTCPEQSINFQSITAKEYINLGQQVMKTLQSKTCTECGESFRTDEIHIHSCVVCRNKMEKSPSRFFA